MPGWQDFTGLNRGYVLELYDRFRQDPSSVDPATRALFERWTPPAEGLPPEGGSHDLQSRDFAKIDLHKVVGAVTLAESIRRYGHLAAQLDPLGGRPVGDPSLRAETHSVSDDDLRKLPASLVGGPAAAGAATALEAIEALRRIYCSTTGYDYAHVFVPEERDWLRQAAESERFRPPMEPIDGDELLDRLTQVEAFERFLHRTFPGKTRFSLEGLDMLVPVLDEIICDGSEGGIRHMLIGMAHRGR